MSEFRLEVADKEKFKQFTDEIGMVKSLAYYYIQKNCIHIGFFLFLIIYVNLIAVTLS